MNNRYGYKHNPIVRRIFLAMLAPTILMNLTTAIGSMADTVIIGQYLDDSALSVVTFATPVYMVINTFAALFAVGGCIAMSIDAGKGEKQTANRAFSLSMELLTAVGALLLLIGAFFSSAVAGWLGAGADVFDLVREYAQIVLLGAPIFMLNIGVAFFVRNDGRPTLSMVGMFSSIVVDIVLNVVLVGYTPMGVAGAAWSTVIGQVVSLVIIGSHFFSRKSTLAFCLTFGKEAWRIIKNGASAALHFIYQFVTILIINHFLANFAGTDGVVIYTVVFNLSTVSLSVFEGISQTIQPMISNYYGEKSIRNIKATLRLAVLAVVIICGAVTLFLETAPEVVPMIFGLDQAALIADAAVAVRIFALSIVIMTINVVIGYYLQSTEQNTMAAVMISLRCFVLFLGATLLLGKLFGMNGVWTAYVVAEVLSFAAVMIMICVKRRSLKRRGQHVDWLLLDRDTARGISCFTYRSSDDFTDFSQTVCEALASYPTEAPAKRYLAVLEEVLTDDKARAVEVEIHASDSKVIIRDNTDHTAVKDRLQEAVAADCKADYGPVLGWNRVSIERGEVL